MSDDDQVFRRARSNPPRSRRRGKTLLWILVALVLAIAVVAFRISTHKHAPDEHGTVRLSQRTFDRGRT